MNPRVGLLAACCAIALTCGVSVVAVCRHWAIASTVPMDPQPARRSSERRPSIEVAPSAVRPRIQTEVAVAPPPLAVSVAAPSKSSSETKLDEDALMRLLRSARRNDPALAMRLAREGNRRFPRSSDAPERASILIHALVEQGLSSEARGEAEELVNHYPDSAWVHEVEQFTGARRHRNIRVGPNGELYYVDPTRSWL